MAEKLRITIIGLGLIGTSAGLALRRYSDKVTVLGHDRDPGTASKAKSRGAVDRTDWNLINAVSDADRILLALPVSEIRQTLEAIAGDLKPGCILLDTSEVKVPVMRWAAELLPDNVHLVGGHPILVVENLDTDSANATLFDNKLFCLTPDTKTHDTAVRLAADLAEALGAKPFFLDPAEHDGMMAAVEHLPAVMAGALMAAASNSSGWNDMRKVAGSQFYSSTLIMAGDGQAIVSGLAANREHVVRWLDRIIDELGEWRQRLASEKDEELAKAFDHGLEAGQNWLRAQATGDWGEGPAVADIPTTGSYMRSLIGFGGLRRRERDARPRR